MLRFASALSVIALVAVACETDPPTAVRRPPSPTFPLLSNGGITASTTGGGMFDLSAAGLPPARFAFSAVQPDDGSAAGQFHQYREGSGGLVVDFSGEVTCITIDPVNHRAWIGGVVTQNNSTDPNFLTIIHEVGDDVWFRVVDYGEGNAAQPDRSTVLGFAGAGGIFTSADYCRIQPWPAGDARTWPVTEGNIQVRQ